MARINIDDGLESRNEFWALLEIYKDRDMCLGKLVRFFRVAQHRYGHSEPLTRADLCIHGLEVMIETGWAITQQDGSFRVFNDEKHFGWYRQKVIASEKATALRAKKSEANENKQVALPGLETRTTETPAPDHPLSLSLSLSLSPSKEERRGGTSEFESPEELKEVAELFAARKIPTALQLLWLKKYCAEYILVKVEELKEWELTAGPKGRKSNWGRYYSGAFRRDWDGWIARKPSGYGRTAQKPAGTARSEHKAPETNWVNDLFNKESK